MLLVGTADSMPGDKTSSCSHQTRRCLMCGRKYNVNMDALNRERRGKKKVQFEPHVTFQNRP